MSIILGIDSGGTHTDAVIFDTSKGQLLCKAKAFTTKNNLHIGISKAIERLRFDRYEDIEKVHISTTLATNSILENRIANVGLVLLGSDIKKPLPFKRKYVVYDKYVNLPHDLDEKEIKAEFACHLDAIVVSASDAKYDKEDEQTVATYFQNQFKVPVYCTNRKNGQSSYYERTLRTVLNTGLKPIIANLLDSLKHVLTEKNIHAPIYIMKSCGTLMDQKSAANSPIDTVMSGPAASVAGAQYLVKEKDFLLIDMGGTSADVTKIQDNIPRMRSGATVANDYPINLAALDIQSFAIGGDSHIYYNQLGKLCVGPQKVIPLCVAANYYPSLLEELIQFRKPENYEMFSAYETDCYIIGTRKLYTALTDFERKVVTYVKDRPHSLFCIADHFKTDPDSLHLTSLVNQGYLQRISFTPTDLLHVTGKYLTWNREISQIAIRMLANLGKCTIGEFIENAETLINNNLVFSCMQSIANFEEKQFDFRNSDATVYLLDKYLRHDNPYFEIDFKIRKPIVAIGAPSGSWMPKVAKKLDTRLILPENYEVANAIGAAVTEQYEESEEK